MRKTLTISALIAFSVLLSAWAETGGKPLKAAPVAARSDFGPVVNPMLAPYNAKCNGPGDPNDAEALQAAIDAAENSSTPVLYIPNGANCAFNNTLFIAGNLTVLGATSQFSASLGSILTYTGAGDAFQVGSPGKYSYNVSFENLNFVATNGASSLIRFYGIDGPATVANNIFSGNWSAVSALIYDAPAAGIQTVIYNNYFQGFQGDEVILRGYSNVEIDANQFFATRGTGLYLSNPGVIEVHNNYFELMPTAIEIANDDENHFKVSIHDNKIRNSNSPGTGSDPTANAPYSASQRCILVRSTADNLPFYGEGSIRDNECTLSVLLSSGFIQGSAPYGIEFATSSNRFYVNQAWEVENNAIDGVTTAGISSDSQKVVVHYSDDPAVRVWTPGSSPPVYLPPFHGPGQFILPSPIK
jgi:hypothetical protein